ncbi:MAG: cell division protein FtsZ [Cryomorphaceae bacterium]|jgi:cell division protein FtsZ
MISYQKEQQQTIPDSEVIIVGVGGAGANMIDRVALDGMEDTQQLALNTDSRTLTSSVAKNKIQMGTKLTRGLGCGGDPELGLRAAMEVEAEIRDALRGHKMVFVCVGLGGGTGSGAAPLVTRVARELGAFVVVFATMPFGFEGSRRREQSETSLNELSVLANALVTFDNGRMGELVLAGQGIHEAFSAADRMISESIRAVTRLVIRPGLINIGLDDLMSSLRATRSRCLFGSGIAKGENRSKAALKSALNSPLLDKGKLLKNTQTALVHVCGGSDMTLYEVELLMLDLSKTVPDTAHILFGAAVDDSMGDSLSVTIISSLPEELVSVTNGESKAEANAEANVVAALDVPEPVKEELQEGAQEMEAPEDQEELAAEEEAALTVEEPEPEVEEKAIEEVTEENAADAPEVTIVDEDLDAAEESEKEMQPEPEEPETEEPVSPTSKGAQSNATRPAVPQGELLLDGGPRGKFEGEAPNLVDGEDLDIPAFLRKKK